MTAKTIRWAQYDHEDVLLYEPTAAAKGRAIVELAQRIHTWGDFRRALAEEPADLVQPIADLVWERWENCLYEYFGLSDEQAESERFASVNDISSLASAFDQDDGCPADPMSGDGEPELADPFDPQTMGIPAEVGAEFYVERSNMVSSWSACPVTNLPAVEERLRQLGYRLEKGDLSNLPHF